MFQNSVDKSMRVCRNCNTGKVEMHFLLICPAYAKIRKRFIGGKLLPNRNQISCNKLMNTHRIDELRNLAYFLRNAF